MEEDNEEENLIEDKEKKMINTNKYNLNNILSSNNRYKNNRVECETENAENKNDLEKTDSNPGNNRNNVVIDFKNVENVCLISSGNKSKDINESSDKCSVINIQESKDEEELKMSQPILNEMTHTVIGTNINLDSDFENESQEEEEEEIIILKRKKTNNESNNKNVNKIERNANLTIEKEDNNIEEEKETKKYSSKTYKGLKKRQLLPECINAFSFNS